MMPLTERQRDCLAFLQVATNASGGVCPSYDEIKDTMGLASKSQIHYLVCALEERGRIRRLPDRARAIDIIAPLTVADGRRKSDRRALVAALRRQADRLEAKL